MFKDDPEAAQFAEEQDLDPFVVQNEHGLWTPPQPEVAYLVADLKTLEAIGVLLMKITRENGVDVSITREAISNWFAENCYKGNDIEVGYFQRVEKTLFNGGVYCLWCCYESSYKPNAGRCSDYVRRTGTWAD